MVICCLSICCSNGLMLAISPSKLLACSTSISANMAWNAASCFCALSAASCSSLLWPVISCSACKSLRYLTATAAMRVKSPPNVFKLLPLVLRSLINCAKNSGWSLAAMPNLNNSLLLALPAFVTCDSICAPWVAVPPKSANPPMFFETASANCPTVTPALPAACLIAIMSPPNVAPAIVNC